MDDRARGAADLLAALNRADRAFRAYGYAQFLAHPSVTPGNAGGFGRAAEPYATVGVSFHFQDVIDRGLYLTVDLSARDGGFLVEGYALLDDPLPGRGGSANQRFLRELPDVRTGSLDEAIEAVERMTADFCAYGALLDDLGVPRG